MRVCFINENIGGHGTLHQHLRIALEDHPEVDARTVDVHPAGRCTAPSGPRSPSWPSATST